MSVMGLLMLDLFIGRRMPTTSFIMCCLIAGCTLLIMVPSISEEFDSGRRIILGSEVLFFTVYFIARETDVSSCSFAVLALTPFILVGFFAFKSMRKFRLVRSLFQPESVWLSVEEYSRFFYSVVLLALALLSGLAFGLPKSSLSQICVVGLCCGALGLFVVLWLRSYSGRTLLVPERKEAIIKEKMSGSPKITLPETPEEEARMNSTYKQVLAYMEKERPYLKDSYYITDLCTDLGVNKVYISNVINVYSGRNFRQFVNYYRIQYAVGIMKENPTQLMMELALMSGFHSVVSFNMAFKLFMKCTPSEYMAKVKGAAALSSLREQDS